MGRQGDLRVTPTTGGIKLGGVRMCYCGMPRYGRVPHPIVGQLNTAVQLYNASWHNLHQNPLHT